MGAVLVREDTAPLPRWILSVGLALGLAVRLAFVWFDDGIWWPDEVFQSLEPAHRAVFGSGWQAWEFLEGARHWTLPGLVAGVMQIGAWLHVSPVTAVESVCCLANVAIGAAVFLLARAQGASSRSSTITALVFTAMGLSIFISPRATGEHLSALPVTLAFAMLVRTRRLPDTIVAGALLSLAVGLRLQNGLFCLGALALVPEEGSHSRARLTLALTLLGGALIYGLVDWLTWGAPFHSAQAYLGFNLVEGRASAYGTSPWWKYFAALITAEGVTLIPVLLLCALGAKQRWSLTAITLFVLLVHTAIPHKELRFLFPLIPLWCAQAAVGLDRAPRWAGPGLVGAALISLLTLPWLTFGRLGISDPPRATSALDFGGPENRLLVLAGQREHVCGLRIDSLEHWRTRGFSAFHRNVPLYGRDAVSRSEGHVDLVIARRGSLAGRELAVDHDVALIELETPCTPDPAYDWRLEAP